ncbi:MAG: SEC-C metal-binding domain-containing protein, partial [Treponema sp.]|nr:SEC-C metal-binding domain-containing protein [Treponema sp.]
LEGFQIFDTMIDDIRQLIASRLHLVRIQTGEDREARYTAQAASTHNATHNSMGAFSASGVSAPGGSSAPRPAARAQGSSVTVVRSQPKVGRNDPCPCGSGKKYKVCHGRT